MENLHKVDKHLHTITHHARQTKWKNPKSQKRGEEETYLISWNSVPAPPAQWKMGGELIFILWVVYARIKIIAYNHRNTETKESEHKP